MQAVGPFGYSQWQTDDKPEIGDFSALVRKLMTYPVVLVKMSSNKKEHHCTKVCNCFCQCKHSVWSSE